MLPRTKRQRQVLDYIQRFNRDHGYSPSYQQIARDLGISSKGAIAKHIDALEDIGLLKRVRENKTFQIVLTIPGTPNLGGFQIEFFTDPKSTTRRETIPFSLDIFGIRSDVALGAYRVPDDSLTGEMISEGDLALFEIRDFARDRDIVLALVNKSSFLLRKFFRRGAEIELRPANPNFETLNLAADKVEILGIFKALVRSAT